MWKRIISALRLSYENPKQELEYIEFKAPLIKSLCIWLFVFIALLWIPLTFRYVIKNLYPAVYLGIVFFVVAIIVFIFRKFLRKYIEFISVTFLSLMLTLYIINMRNILDLQKPHEAFYMGYGFALTQRMLDYRISKFPVFIVFNMVFTILKFTLVVIPDGALGVLVVCLEIFPMMISFQVERAERLLFASFHKSKCQLLKFKKFLTEHFPGPMVVIARSSPQNYFANDSFKKSFQCQDISQLKASLQKLELDTESIQKNRSLFGLIGYNENGVQQTKHQLTELIDLFLSKYAELQNSKPISLQITQDVDEKSQDIAAFKKEVANLEKIIFQSEVKAPCHGPILSDNHNFDLKKMSIELDNYAKPLVNSSAKKIFWKTTVFPLPCWDDDDAIAILLDDITHEKTIIELEIADKNKDMVIAMVSHELRTPLNGILGMIDITQKKLKSFGLDNNSDIFGYLDATMINSRFLLNLVNSILDFSQFKNNKLTLDYSYVNISNLLEQMRPLFDHFCKTKNLFLKIHVDPGVPHTIFTDQGRLSQILINLIGNAFKFTFNGGVTVSVTPESHCPYRVRITVEDTGVGINKQDIEKLFNLFGRLEEHKKINARGVGLGLTLSNTLAKLLDSDNSKGIEVISEVGKGSTFKFTVKDNYIPYKSSVVELSTKEQLESLSIQNKMRSYSHDKKQKIFAKPSSSNTKDTSQDNSFKKAIQEDFCKDWCLLVDDNPFNLIVAEHLMEERGYKIKTALNGKEAIEKIQEHQNSGNTFKVILMDCEMPVMNGYEATKILTKMMKEGEVVECPIVAATANINDDRQKKLFKEAGMSGYLSKPLQKDQLEEILTNLVKK